MIGAYEAINAMTAVTYGRHQALLLKLRIPEINSWHYSFHAYFWNIARIQLVEFLSRKQGAAVICFVRSVTITFVGTANKVLTKVIQR
jgi:hypothetical protein